MAENGGLLSVTITKNTVEPTQSDCKCLFDGTDDTSTTVTDMKELCCAAASQEHLDGQTNGCNGQESCENCYPDSGISNSADMDVCSMEVLDDSEANGEDYTADEENVMTFGTRHEMVNVSTHRDTGINNVPNSLSKMNGDGTAETVLSCDSSVGKCTIYDGNCNIETSAECSHDVDECDINSDDVLPLSAVDVQSNQHPDEVIADDSALQIKVDNSNDTCHNDGTEVSDSRADDVAKSCPNSAVVTSTDVESLPADKSLNEGNAAEASADIAVFTSAATCQSQSQPIFTPSRSVPRPLRQSRPRLGSYGSPPSSATPSSSCPDDDTSKQQYVVNVHVNPGETFSVCVSDQVQLIQGNICAFYLLI